MLRFYIGTLEKDADWPKCLPRIQSVLNNSTATTGKSPNEVCYGFTPNFTADYPTKIPNLPAARIKVANALDFAAINMKHYYDQKHTAMFFAVGD